MKSSIKFSIIIPVYNVEKYLKRCVNSVIGQTFTNFEVILVDDGSTDGSSKICDDYKKFDSRCNIIHKENAGLSEARNSGIHVAVGEYILFVDSDDFWEDTNFLMRMSKYVIQEPEYVMLTFKRCDEQENRYWNVYPRINEKIVNQLPYADRIEFLVKKDMFLVSACSKIVKTDVLKKKQIFFEEGLIGEDIDWCCKLVSSCNHMLFFNESGYVYRVREGSITRSKNTKVCTDLYFIIEKWMQYFLNEKKLKLQEAMLSFLSYEFYVLLGNARRIGMLDQFDVDNFEKLLKYSKSKKTILCKFVYNVFGRNAASKVFAWVIGKK